MAQVIHIPNWKNMMVQHEQFFEAQTGEVRDRGLKLVAITRGLLEHFVQGQTKVFEPASDYESREQWEVKNLQSAIDKHNWNVTKVAEEIGISEQTVRNRIKKYRPLLQAGLAAVIVFLVGCSTPVKTTRFQGDETSMLILQPDFAQAAIAAPQFTSYTIRTINRLEYEYHSAKHSARYCRSCQIKMRARIARVHSEPPPMPPALPSGPK